MISLIAPIGIVVSTYEEGSPVLSHIFWGKDVDEAMGYAQSHMETDEFFRSSFKGTMEWHGSTLYLEDVVQVVAKFPHHIGKDQVSSIRDTLYSIAYRSS